MFKRLQKKWKVGPLQIILIIICFAVGGSVTGFAAKKIMNLLFIQQDWLWAIIYILLITIIWPVAVIVVSIFFRQFKFFSGYVRRLCVRLGLVQSSESGVRSSESGVQSKESGVNSSESIVDRDRLTVGRRQSLRTQDSRLATHDSRLTTQIAVFASGAGSNAQKIIEHFRNSSMAKVVLIVCNNPGAGVLKIAEGNKIPTLIIEKEKFFRGNGYLDELKGKKIDFIVLAGFLWKIPKVLLKAYPKRIINIHPALLPKHGGKGMYGSYVHEAVLTAKEKESGITIHYVDEHYDNGDIILQVKCPVLENDNSESLAHRIHVLEHANYPVIIEELVRKLIS